MNRRACSNCETMWPSVVDHELEGPHNCPRCGDELGPVAQQFAVASASPAAAAVLTQLAA